MEDRRWRIADCRSELPNLLFTINIHSGGASPQPHGKGNTAARCPGARSASLRVPGGGAAGGASLGEAARGAFDDPGGQSARPSGHRQAASLRPVQTAGKGAEKAAI